MKTRLDNVGNVILDFKRFQQERQAQLANQVTTPPEDFSGRPTSLSISSISNHIKPEMYS